jgi:hypothetical protein
MSTFWRILLLVTLLILCAKRVEGFQTIGLKAANNKAKGFVISSTIKEANALFMSSDPDDSDSSSLLDRFTNPVLDDPFLPITDVSMAQIVAPALQVFWISLVHAPSPTWLQPIFGQDVLWQARGSLLAPTLIHGAGLACCWLLGALAARAYEFKAIDPTIEGGGYGTVLATILKAGAFATGALIFATQLDLLVEYGRYVQPGESEEIDLRLLSATVEVLNDIIFEAGVLTSLRLYLAVSTANGKIS